MTRFDYDWLADVLAVMLETDKITEASANYFVDRIGFKYQNFNPVRFWQAVNRNRVRYKGVKA